MKDLKIAAVCMHSETGEIKNNLAKMRSIVSEASKIGTDIICFPELCVTGYTLKNIDKIYNALFNTKSVIEHVEQMAQKNRMVIIAGFIEFSFEGEAFITQMVAGPDGIIGFYRKTHLSPAEQKVYKPGGDIKIFSYGGTTFGVQLCYEAHFPEISTTQALMGADIIFIPHASPRGTPPQKLRSWLRHLPGRAFDNGLFVVACNLVGKTNDSYSFPGVAVVLSPQGNVISQYADDEKAVLYTELKADLLFDCRTSRKKYFLLNRRPELYGMVSK